MFSKVNPNQRNVLPVPDNVTKNVRKIPDKLNIVVSQVKPTVTTFIWEIKGVTTIRNKNLWNVPYCQFEAGGFQWKLSLFLAENGKGVYGRPKLLGPQDSTTSYYIKFNVIDDRDMIVYTSPFVNDHPVNIVAGEGATQTDLAHKWEVIKLSTGPLDQFNTIVFNDTLKLMVEMTVFVDSKQH